MDAQGVGLGSRIEALSNRIRSGLGALRTGPSAARAASSLSKTRTFSVPTRPVGHPDPRDEARRLASARQDVRLEMLPAPVDHLRLSAFTHDDREHAIPSSFG